MIELVPLSQWLHTQAKQNIAVWQSQFKTSEDLLSRVSYWVNCLQQQQGTRWAVYHHDAFEFLAIVLALWQLNRTACIPGDNGQGTIERLTDHVDGFIGEFSCPVIRAQLNMKINPSQEWSVLSTDFNAIEIYTSGSTGQPKAISKTIAQLESEIAVLESLWPSQCEDVVLATVSHQHLYGLTFRLLWPFSSGRAFARELCEYTEDIFQQASYHSAFTLISSPSHLSRMNPAINWSELSSYCHSVISSAAPLRKEDSLQVGRLLNTSVREIYGSSETGIIAWRIQQENEVEALWKTVPKVQLQRLTSEHYDITSPFLNSAEPFILPDQIRCYPDGRFALLGRIDGIVKIEGKRVSLATIEQLLLLHQWTDHAKALVIERQRVETAVVIQLNNNGRQQLKYGGRKSLITEFKALLSIHFEAIVLPRRWRFVTQMPYNSQGKLVMKSLQAMFDKQSVSTQWPTIIAEEISDNAVTLQATIPSSLIYFEGHFDNQAILPGIVMIHWAIQYGQRFLPIIGRFKRLEVIKFQQVIIPEARLMICLTYDGAKQKLSFRYESKKGIHSSGRICYGE